MAPSLSEVSLPMKFSVPALFLGIVLFAVSFSVSSWFSGSLKGANGESVDFHGGLWRFCSSVEDAYDNLCFSWSADQVKAWKKDWLLGPQVVECLALVCLIVVFGSFVTFAITRMKLAVIAVMVSSCVSGIFMMIGYIVYATKFNNDVTYSNFAHLTWGFAFNIIASIFTFGGAIGFGVYLIFAKTTGNRPT